MTLSNYDLFYIITNIFDVYIIYKFMSAFFDRKDANRKIEIVSYTFYFFSFTSVYLFLNIPIVTLSFALAITALNVNTTCYFLIHQPKLPKGAEKLRRF